MRVEDFYTKLNAYSFIHKHTHSYTLKYNSTIFSYNTYTISPFYTSNDHVYLMLYYVLKHLLFFCKCLIKLSP